MIIISHNEPRQVVAWNWPWEGDSDLVAASKALDKSKLEKLNKVATEFASSIKDFVSSTSHETGGLALTKESAQDDLKEFKARLSRFENVVNPILSNAVVLHEELRSRGIRAPFFIDDPVKDKKVGMDEVYMSLYETAQAAEKNWDEDAFRRIYLSIIAGRMMNLQKGISEWAASYANPEFIKKADRAEPIRDLPEDLDLDVDKPKVPAPQTPGTEIPPPLSEPQATPEVKQRLKMGPRDPNAPYFSGTGGQGKSKERLLDDVLFAFRLHWDKLPEDLKPHFNALVKTFEDSSGVKTAGFAEQVYAIRKGDIDRLIHQWVDSVGGDYASVKAFENAVFEHLETVWDTEDFPEIEPKDVDDVAAALKTMVDAGNDKGKIISTLSSMLMKLSGGNINRLNDLAKEKPNMFRSGLMAEALEKVRQTIASSKAMPTRAPAGSGLSKAPPPQPDPAPQAPAAPVPQAPASTPQGNDPFEVVPSNLPKITAPAKEAPAPEPAPKPKARRPRPAIRPTVQ